MSEEKQLTIPKRPGVGSIGKKTKVLTNLYEVTLTPKATIQLYALIYSQDVSKRLRSRFFSILKEQFPDDFKQEVAYDEEKMIFSPETLPIGKEKQYELNLGKTTFPLTIRHVGLVPLKELADFVKSSKGDVELPRDAVQGIEVALGHYPKLTMTSAGRGYFDGKSVFDIADGAQVWLGYRQSIKLGQGKVYLNVDLAVSAFHAPSTVLEFITKIEGRQVEELIKRNRGSLPADTVKKVNRKLKGLSIDVNYMGSKRKYKCNSITKKSAAEYKFSVPDSDKEISVADYFYNKFNISLHYPELPLLHVGPPKKNIMLPIELCSISKGQRLNKLTPKMTADVIKNAAKKPDERLKLIKDSIDTMRDPNANALSSVFGISVGKNLAQVEARVLDPPKVHYNAESKEAVVAPKGGQWRAENSKFLKAATVSRWGIVSFERDRYLPEREIMDIVGAFVKFGGECGISFQERRPPIIYGDSRNSRGIQDSIKDAMQTCLDTFGEAPQIIFFFLPGNATTSLYAEIKRTCETVVDVPSQCMQTNKVKKKQPAYIKNLMLKVNAKLGGTNWIIEKAAPWTFYMSRPAIIFGADVTHAGAGSNMPSIAAVVGSMDGNCSKYGAEYRVQGHRVEVITELQDMVRNLLMRFYKSTGGKKPEKILFYRDGVSEGQFDAVLEHEVKAIRSACMSLEKGYTPPITFVVVQKRHHVRLFPTNPRDADRSGNVQAGTVVDSVVTHPSQFDFYLCSHGGLQGTSKPCHYHVLFDENGFNANNLQQFTNHLCYTYVRCTKSVSLVPPVYYAHLGAFRAKYHSTGELHDDDFSVSGDSTSGDGTLELAPVKPRTNSVMYFV